MSVAAPQIMKKRHGDRRRALVAASTVIYEGTLVFINASGYAVGIVASGVNKFFGIATRTVDNSSGSAGDVACEVDREGSYELAGADFTQAHVGFPAFASDNYTLTPTPGAVSRVGIVEEYISATKVLVRIDEPVAPAATFAAAAGANPTQAEYAAMRTAFLNSGLVTGS